MVGVAKVAQYHEAYKAALNINREFPHLDAPALLILFNNFERLIVPLVNEVSPEWHNCGSLGRHMTFLKRYLEHGQKGACASDASDIVHYDLPILGDFLIAGAAGPGETDPRLFEATNRLFEIGELASVIRAAFPVLSARLRRLFGIPNGTDGENLINLIFSRGEGTNPVRLDESEKTAYRNLLAGFYAAYRNRLSHDDFQPTLSQARGVVEMTNLLIKDLEEVAEQSAMQNLID
ncbi:TIGR02391 family protein [Pseudomonas sp. C9-3]|uniref:TIGR02391 family protein n=1 Tax=Pseudomonas sp. C9-3 TaxID=3078264 RepID=UPI0028E4E5BC|nr:TIGR02391 family protein [Pseudomonas sp. C9-3]